MCHGARVLKVCRGTRMYGAHSPSPLPPALETFGLEVKNISEQWKLPLQKQLT